jgi:uncharacterized protein (DUF1330 family)
MTAYMIAQVDVTDAAEFKKYADLAGAVTAKYGGKYLARGGETEALENYEVGNRVVIIEFPDRAAARAWYESDEYQSAKKFRENAAVGKFLIVEGC